MTDLSPQAQAVLAAVASQMEGEWISPEFIPYEARKIAAALEAAADQMSSHQSRKFLYSIADAMKLRDIAAELRGN